MQSSEATLNGEPACGSDKQKKANAAHFFMSAHTPAGFVSRFDRLYDASAGWRAYILKSAPGVSQLLLQKTGETIEKAGISVEYIHCVSDPAGVSALVLPELKIAMIDAMPPHCINPSFPGVVEDEVTLFALDYDRLSAQRDRILQFSARADAQYDRAYRFLSAASSLQNDSFRIAAECLDNEAVEKYVTGLVHRTFPSLGKQGSCKARYLSAVTGGGRSFFFDETAGSYGRVYAIEDEYGVGRLLLTLLREKTLAAGYDVISCDCPVLGGPEHLFIPSQSVAFVTSNSYHKADGKVCRHINIKRFMDCDTLRLKKARLGFNRRAARELYSQTVELLADAMADQAVVRECYADSVDLPAARKVLNGLVEDIVAPLL